MIRLSNWFSVTIYSALTQETHLMKLVILIILLAIVWSMGSGLWFLAKDDQGSTRVLTSLKVRVALSAALIGFLLLGYFQGWISPHPAI